jgi:lysine 2,3-aminomutase
MFESDSREPLAQRMAPPATGGFDDDEPPSRPRRHPIWHDVPDANWDDWRWQTQNSIRSVRQLRNLLAFSPEELVALGELESDFKLAIPPYYFSLIDTENAADPIRLQSVPSPLERTSDFQLEDPLEEDKDSPVPGLTHRYPDRVLMLTTPNCTMYCRYCTRKRATLTRGGWEGVSKNDERMIDYVRKNKQIRDVIVSGGDPLTLPLGKLKFYIQTHFNHPREITPEAARVCKSLLRHGMPINNHAVLLKGVNDSLETIRSLLRGLLRIKVRPYYLFHCDPVTGAGHFRTSIWKGMQIMEGLRGHMSGIGIPTYVVDSPAGGGKIPLMPNYLVSMSDDAVVLRNYEGMLIRYQATDESGASETTPTRGVSGLLQGDKTSLMPEGNERMARRRKLNVIDPVYEVGGCGEEKPAEEKPRILSLPMMNKPAKRKNGKRKAVKNGHHAVKV